MLSFRPSFASRALCGRVAFVMIEWHLNKIPAEQPTRGARAAGFHNTNPQRYVRLSGIREPAALDPISILS